MSSAPLYWQPLLWDSEFLGFPVARLVATEQPTADMGATIAAARWAGIRLLYLVLDPADTTAAAVVRQADAWLADCKVTFSKKLMPADQQIISTHIGPAVASTPQLEALAQQAGRYSRFRRDKCFAAGVFERLYSHWLRNSLTGSLARCVLVWHNPKGQEQGLLTLSEQNGRVDIGLLAVEETARGQGIGQQLVTAAGAQALAWGCADLQVVTQLDNMDACRFYAQCGFVPVREEHIYHLWLA